MVDKAKKKVNKEKKKEPKTEPPAKVEETEEGEKADEEEVEAESTEEVNESEEEEETESEEVDEEAEEAETEEAEEAEVKPKKKSEQTSEKSESTKKSEDEEYSELEVDDKLEEAETTNDEEAEEVMKRVEKKVKKKKSADKEESDKSEDNSESTDYSSIDKSKELELKDTDKLVAFVASTSILKDMCMILVGKGEDVDGKTSMLNNDFVINLTKEHGILVKCLDRMNATWTKLTIPITDNGMLSNIETREKLEKIPIHDISTFESYVDSFEKGERILVAYQKEKSSLYMFRSHPKKLVTFQTCKIDKINSIKGLDTFPCWLEKGVRQGNSKSDGHFIFDLMVEIDSKYLRDAISDGGKVNRRVYPMEYKKGKFTLTVGEGDNKISSEIPVISFKKPEGSKTLGTSISYGMSNTVKYMNGAVRLYFGPSPNDHLKPVWMYHSNERYTVEHVITPTKIDNSVPAEESEETAEATE